MSCQHPETGCKLYTVSKKQFGYGADFWWECVFLEIKRVNAKYHPPSHLCVGCVTAWFGRALAWHARGHRFDPGNLHIKSTVLRRKYGAFLFAFLEVASRISQMPDFAGAWTATPNSCYFVAFENACSMPGFSAGCRITPPQCKEWGRSWTRCWSGIRDKRLPCGWAGWQPSSLLQNWHCRTGQHRKSAHHTSVCRYAIFFIVQHFFKLCHMCLVLFENLRGLHFHIGIIRHLGEILHQEINILLDSPDGSFQCRIVDSVE